MSLSDILLIIWYSFCLLAACSIQLKHSEIPGLRAQTRDRTDWKAPRSTMDPCGVCGLKDDETLFCSMEICGRKLPKREHMETWPHVGLGFWTVNSWYFRVKSWSLLIRLQDCFPSIWTLPETHKSHRSGVFVDPYQSFNIIFPNTGWKSTCNIIISSFSAFPHG